MAQSSKEFVEFIAEEVKKYEGVYVPLKASRLERMMKKSAKPSELHFFFFKQKTAYEIPLCDWSSDVCSSDLHH